MNARSPRAGARPSDRRLPAAGPGKGGLSEENVAAIRAVMQAGAAARSVVFFEILGVTVGVWAASIS